MVTAGQWQAVKDTLSRPKGRSLTTSDTSGNSTTNTAYNNLFITLHWIQQPSWYDSLDTTTNYSTLHDQYNNLYVKDNWQNHQSICYVTDTATQFIPKQQSTQQASLRSYDTTGNLIQLYTTTDTATLMIWYFDTATNYTTVHDLIQQSLCYDTNPPSLVL